MDRRGGGSLGSGVLLSRKMAEIQPVEALAVAAGLIVVWGLHSWILYQSSLL